MTLTATYDAQYGRVELHITPTPDTDSVTVSRNGDIIPRLSFVTIDGPTTLYDYTAPLGCLARYAVNFYRQGDDVLFLDFVSEASVTAGVGPLVDAPSEGGSA
jgi:hypothetical protein